MKVKFKDWKYISSDSFSNNDEGLEINVNEGFWLFQVDGKEYYWSVWREEYFDEDGDVKGYGYWVRDMNDNRKVLLDSKWIYWGINGSSKIMDKEINEKFNDEISVKDLIFKIDEYLCENLKVSEYENLEIFEVMNVDDYGKNKLIGFEFEL